MSASTILLLFFLIASLFLVVLTIFYSRRDRNNERELMKRCQLQEALSVRLRQQDQQILQLQDECTELYRKIFMEIGDLIEKSLLFKDDKRMMDYYKTKMSSYSALFADPASQQRREEIINNSTGGLFRCLREDFPSFKEIDFQLLSFVIIGFDATLISMIFNINPGTVYTRKSRLKDKISKSNPEHRDLYRRWIF